MACCFPESDKEKDEKLTSHDGVAEAAGVELFETLEHDLDVMRQNVECQGTTIDDLWFSKPRISESLKQSVNSIGFCMMKFVEKEQQPHLASGLDAVRDVLERWHAGRSPR